MKEIMVGSAEQGGRLDKLLLKYLNKVNSSFVYKMLRKKNITLNDKKADGSERLSEGDSIKLWFSDESLNNLREDKSYAFAHLKETSKSDIKDMIVYEDEHILLIDKPVGLLSQKADKKDISINEMVLNYLYQKGSIDEASLQSFIPSVCNRLDRNTSGIVIVAKTLISARLMNKLIKERYIKKEYLCVVSGRLKDEDMLEAWLYKSEVDNKVIVKPNYFEDAKQIKTAYKTLFTDDKISLLLVELITGRTHQIRAHLSYIRHPILGDVKYGDKGLNEQFNKTYKMKSQLLHSYRLTFPDIEGELSYLSKKSFSTVIPKAFKKVCKEYTWQHGSLGA